MFRGQRVSVSVHFFPHVGSRVSRELGVVIGTFR